LKLLGILSLNSDSRREPLTVRPVVRGSGEGGVQSMRRVVAWGCAVASILALGACGFVRWPLSAAKVGDSLNAAIGASPRLHWSAPQAASFAFLPWPSLRIVDARLDDAGGVNFLSAPTARLDLSLIELVRGRFIPTRAILVSPTVTLDIDRPPFAAGGAGSSAPASVAGALAPLSSLSLSNGFLRVVGARRGVDTLIANVQGRLDGLTVGNQLRFNLSAEWRNAPIAVAGVLSDPEAAAKGASSRFQFALDSPMAKFAFDGAVELGEKAAAEGDTSASVPSIAALAAFLNAARPSVLADDDVAISGKVTARADALTLDDATITSGAQTLEGAIEIADAGGRPAVSGTLASESLALEPLFGPPQRLFDPLGGWSAKPLALAPPQTFDLDLRLSASRLDIYGRKLTDAAGSLMVRDGKLRMNLIDASAYGGRLNGEAALSCVGEDVKLSARGELVDADLADAFADFGRPTATGRGAARFSIETAGVSPAAAIAALTGTASLEAADGGIIGVNLEEALRRSQRRPIDVARDMRLGGTAFDKLAVFVSFDDGRAEIERGAMSSRGVSAGLKGLIDLAGQQWALRVNAVQTDASGAESQDAAHLRLDIDGPWTAPTVRAIGQREGAEAVGQPEAPPSR
jgi:AsmA protein